MALCLKPFRTIALLIVALGFHATIALRGEDSQLSASLVVDSEDPDEKSDGTEMEVRALEHAEMTPEDLVDVDSFLDGLLANEMEEEDEEEEEEEDDELIWSDEELDEIMKAKDEEDAKEAPKLDLSPEELDEILDDINDQVLGDDKGEDKDQEDEDCMFASKSEKPLDWLGTAMKSQFNGCQDFGPRFGRWGAAACPSLSAILENLLSGSKEASGGKSGTKPIVSSKFAVKVIDDIEHKMLHNLLKNLKGSRRDTFLVPTCRSLCFKVGGKIRYMQITPNVLLRGGSSEPFTRLFDLKGNYAWSNRAADPMKDYVWKDQNFKKLFPKGLNITQVMFPNGKDDHSLFSGDLAPNFFARTMYYDGKQLAKLGLMDYSLLLHLVAFRGRAGSKAESEVKQLNIDKPWAFATATIRGEEKRFAISFGIIDVLMHQDENRGFLNKIAASLAHCRVSDVDPIPAFPYWIRFCRMFGLKEKFPDRSKVCVSCLDEEDGEGYTYFPSNFVPPKGTSRVSKSCK